MLSFVWVTETVQAVPPVGVAIKSNDPLDADDPIVAVTVALPLEVDGLTLTDIPLPTLTLARE